MKNFLLFTAIACLIATAAFTNHKCEHIYVATVQAEVKIQEPQWSGSVTLLPNTFYLPRGKQEGQELVCVKCFDVRKQVMDYGPDPYRINTLPSWGTLTSPDTCLSVTVDALNRQRFATVRFVVDTLLISK